MISSTKEEIDNLAAALEKTHAKSVTSYTLVEKNFLHSMEWRKFFEDKDR